MTKQQAENERRIQQAKNLRYKKPIAKDLNLESIEARLQEMYEDCEAVVWAMDNEHGMSDILNSVFDDDQDEVQEFKMTFNSLSVDCERMMEDISEWQYTGLYDRFDILMACCVGKGEMLGYDTYVEDYYGLDPLETQWGHEEAVKQMERLTKKQLIEEFAMSAQLFRQFVALDYRHTCLKGAMDALKGESAEMFKAVKRIEEMYEANINEPTWREDKEWERMLNYIHPEAWIA